MFSADIAKALGISLRAGRREERTGIGGVPQTVWVHPIVLYVGEHTLQIEGAFSETLPIAALLGRVGFFENFKITFDPTSDPPGMELERVLKARLRIFQTDTLPGSPSLLWAGRSVIVQDSSTKLVEDRHVYEDFHATDRWTGKPVHCIYQALILAISTRHADAVDIKFLAEGHPVWIALPHPAWVEYNKRTGKVITDPMAVQIAGYYLKWAIETGENGGREMHSLTVKQTLEHLEALLQEQRVGAQLRA